MATRRYPNLAASTRRSLREMPWLAESDKAAADLAVTYATVIQAAGDEVAATAAVAAEARARFGDADVDSDPEVLDLVVSAQQQAAAAAAQHAKLVGWHGPHLLNALRALGGAPVERRELDKKPAGKSKLAELRSRRASG